MKQTSKWYLANAGNGYRVIRRDTYPDGKLKREVYPREKWAKVDPSDSDAVASLLRRLNATYERKKAEAEARYDLDHTYINKPLIEEFQRQRAFHTTVDDHLRDSLTNLRRAIDYFVIKKKLASPADWERKQFDFGEHLLKAELSLHTIQKTQVVTNQYLEFLHKKFPHEVPRLELMLITPAKRKLLRADAEENERGQLILDSHYRLLLRYGGDIKPHIELAWCFGGRRSEILGLQVENVFVDNLEITRQIESCPVKGEPIFKPTKGRMKREVPYWFTTPEIAYDLISRIKLMSKHTLSDRFAMVVAEINRHEGLQLSYTFHDLRHTFITRAVRLHGLVDVSRAAGHKDVRTTQEYMEDDRQLSKQRFVPLAVKKTDRSIYESRS